MITLIQVKINTLEDYENKLKPKIKSSLVDDDVIERLRTYIGNSCNIIEIEYPYYDSDYLSTFYLHYSQKFKFYDKLCCRLHIKKDDEYYGYITLRPTVFGTKIGKTYLEPNLFIKSGEIAYLMQTNFKVHAFGASTDIKCFPWKRQETDISICAHTAVWTVLRYLSNTSNYYADTTIGKITEMISNDWGRKTPSLGLSPVQVSDIFKEVGLSPIIIGSTKSEEDIFFDEIISYVESGIPIIGFFPKHAISIIGRGNVKYDLIENENFINKRIEIDEKTNIILHSRLIDSTYVMDDRYFPYRKVPLDIPDSNSDVNYGMGEISYIVIPLYHRVQLVYSDIYARLKQWIKGKVMNWGVSNVCRIYITSSNSLKEEVNNSKTIADELRDIILTLNLPKFVWCIDLASPQNYKKNLINGRIIIDTTCATLEPEPWILRHNSDRIEYIDNESRQSKDNNSFIIKVKQVEIVPYEIHYNNLDLINNKGET